MTETMTGKANAKVYFGCTYARAIRAIWRKSCTKPAHGKQSGGGKRLIPVLIDLSDRGGREQQSSPHISTQ